MLCSVLLKMMIYIHNCKLSLIALGKYLQTLTPEFIKKLPQII